MQPDIERNFLSDDFASFARGTLGGSRAIAVIPDDVKLLLTATSDVLLLSQATAIKQFREHPDIVPVDYMRVQKMLDRGELLRDRALHLGLLQEQGKWFYAVIKATKSGESIYLQSLRRTNVSDINDIRARSQLVRQGK